MSLKVEKVVFDSPEGYKREREGEVEIVLKFDGPLLKNGWYVKGVGIAFDWDYKDRDWDVNRGILKRDMTFFVPEVIRLKAKFRVPKDASIGRHDFMIYYSTRTGDLHLIYEGEVLVKE